MVSYGHVLLVADKAVACLSHQAANVWGRFRKAINRVAQLGSAGFQAKFHGLLVIAGVQKCFGNAPPRGQ
jgi:hypothetical protein